MSSAPHSAAVAIGENPRLQAAEMESLFEGYANERVILWVPVRAFGAGSGGLAFASGYSADTARAGKQGPRRYGKFFNIWRQEPDGQWRWVFDLGSIRP